MRRLVLLLFLVMCRSDKRKIPIYDARYAVGFFTFGRAVRYDDGAPLLGAECQQWRTKRKQFLVLAATSESPCSVVHRITHVNYSTYVQINRLVLLG